MSMLATAPCRPNTQCTKRRAIAAVADLSGHVWTHPNPLHLYRWVSRRNELLRTLGAAVQRPPARRAG
jgi:hypothetical protein